MIRIFKIVRRQCKVLSWAFCFTITSAWWWQGMRGGIQYLMDLSENRRAAFVRKMTLNHFTNGDGSYRCSSNLLHVIASIKAHFVVSNVFHNRRIALKWIRLIILLFRQGHFSTQQLMKVDSFNGFAWILAPHEREMYCQKRQNAVQI